MNGELDVEAVSVRFGGVIALGGVDLSVALGEIVGLIGPNGAGKTTLFDVITGFVRPNQGSVKLKGKDLASHSPAKRARDGIRRTFQMGELFDDVSVIDNIRVAQQREASLDDAHEILDRLGLTAVANMWAGEVPAGTRRLVGIARALGGAPSVLLLDEPAAGLPDDEVEPLANLLRSLAATGDLGIVVVDHDMSLIDVACDRVSVLNFGEIIATGTCAEIRQRPEVVEAYLGA